MHVSTATDRQEWDSFLCTGTFRPFLQSWTMGEVYRECGQEPLRLIVHDAAGQPVAVCMALLVPARRGRHLSIPYGPVVRTWEALPMLMQALRDLGVSHHCSFLRISPTVPASEESQWKHALSGTGTHAYDAPLHLLAEQLWYIPLQTPDPWGGLPQEQNIGPVTEESILANMRKTTRNLVRRADKEGVEVTASNDPNNDLEHFLTLHEETRKRHGFTPYTDAFFRAQVKHFSAEKQCSVYIARHQGTVLATSIHMHFGGETSYHHGASIQSPIPASYALQWKAIRDALARKDRVYNFWGIAPEGAKNHPFAGVTLFKTGFGGSQLSLMHCIDVPLSKRYHVTRAFEFVRKWKRGF